MTETRRGFLSLLGLSPFAAKSAADSMTAPKAIVGIGDGAVTAFKYSPGLMALSTSAAVWNYGSTSATFPPKKID